MAFAPHTNEDAHLPLLLGCFTEKEYGNLFEYAERPADDRGGWMIEGIDIALPKGTAPTYTGTGA